MSNNPYAAPTAAVADFESSVDGDFIPTGQSVSIGNAWPWITEAWRLFRQQPFLWIGALILMFIVLAAAGAIPYIGLFLQYILYPIFGGGLMLGCHALWKNERMTFGQLFGGFQYNSGSLALLGALMGAALFAIMLLMGSLTGFGATFFLDPGDQPPVNMEWTRFILAILIDMALSIPVYMALWFAPALILLHNFGAVQAIKSSFIACLKNMLPFLLYGILMFVLITLSALPLALGLLITIPLSVISIYTAYRDIFYSA